MATTYVVLREVHTVPSRENDANPRYHVVAEGVEAASAAQARVIATKTLSDQELDAGVTLRAVPTRNWESGRGSLKAETQRRIRSA